MIINNNSIDDDSCVDNYYLPTYLPTYYLGVGSSSQWDNNVLVAVVVVVVVVVVDHEPTTVLFVL